MIHPPHRCIKRPLKCAVLLYLGGPVGGPICRNASPHRVDPVVDWPVDCWSTSLQWLWDVACRHLRRSRRPQTLNGSHVQWVVPDHAASWANGPQDLITPPRVTRDPDEDEERVEELPWDGFWQFVQKFFGCVTRMGHLGGEEAGYKLWWTFLLPACQVFSRETGLYIRKIFDLWVWLMKMGAKTKVLHLYACWRDKDLTMNLFWFQAQKKEAMSELKSVEKPLFLFFFFYPYRFCVDGLLDRHGLISWMDGRVNDCKGGARKRWK